MTFDEAETKVENLVGDLNIPLGVEGTLLDIIDKLREEYAPKVEMTSRQKETLLTMKGDKISLVTILAEFYDGNLINDFDNLYWFPMTETKLVQAWLHPETIKIDDEQLKEV